MSSWKLSPINELSSIPPAPTPSLSFGSYNYIFNSCEIIYILKCYIWVRLCDITSNNGIKFIPCYCKWQDFTFSRLVNIMWHISRTFSYPGNSEWGHKVHRCPGNVSGAEMNARMLRSLSPLGCAPRSGIAVSYGSSIFSFWGKSLAYLTLHVQIHSH